MQIAVIGAADTDEEKYAQARAAGALISGHAILICGGMGGVMEAACRGAREQGGRTVGILPDMGIGNPYLDVVIRTGLGHARNAVVVQSADAVIAIGGGFGTLSEIAIALKTGRPVYGLDTWDLEGVIPCATPEEAVERATGTSYASPSPRP